MAIALYSLGKLLLEKGEAASAEPMLREALVIQRKTSPKNDWSTHDTASVLGACLTATRRYDEAEPLLTESYERLKAGRGAGDKRTLEALNRLISLISLENHASIRVAEKIGSRPGRIVEGPPFSGPTCVYELER